MKSGLLKVYAKNQDATVFNYLSLVIIFGCLKVYLNPAVFTSHALIVGVFLMVILCVGAILNVRMVYARILSPHHPVRSADCPRLAVNIAFSRAVYIVPWLVFLFYPPVATDALLYHTLGYIFVVFAVMAYIPASAAYFPLFLVDVAIPIVFAAVMALMNFKAPYSLYILGGLLLLASYAFVHGLKLSRSIREMEESRMAYRQMAQEAEKANRGKSDFLAMMSHEIRTPMTGIMGMVDFLRETNISDEQRSCLETISQCSKTLLNTLNDVLDMTRVESGNPLITYKNFDYHNLLEQTVRILQPTADKKKIDLRIRIEKNVPQMVHADPHRLQQVLTNLLNNALKFTSDGFVELHASYWGNNLRVEVMDTGIGIAPDKMVNLFKKFSQLDNSIHRKYGGSGLGLSITKRLVELMNGKIGVRANQNGRGSSFWFEVPYLSPVSEAGDVPAYSQSAVLPMNVLLVEDNNINQMIIGRLLEKKGHKVVTLSDANTIMDVVAAGSYDIILMDCTLPGKSGIEAATEIRASGSLVPIIALTANGIKEHIEKCHEAGMNEHVLKPFSPDEFFTLLAKYGHPDPSADIEKPAEVTVPKAVPPSLHPRLQMIVEEFGLDYMKTFVRASADDILRLCDVLLSDQAVHHYGAVHDIKSLSSGIGLDATAAVAAQAEAMLFDKARTPLAEIEEMRKTAAATARTEAEAIKSSI
jgi:signal transduction histidine kinase/ActR/RegA family two-component response regulator